MINNFNSSTPAVGIDPNSTNLALDPRARSHNPQSRHNDRHRSHASSSSSSSSSSLVDPIHLTPHDQIKHLENPLGLTLDDPMLNAAVNPVATSTGNIPNNGNMDTLLSDFDLSDFHQSAPQSFSGLQLGTIDSNFKPSEAITLLDTFDIDFSQDHPQLPLRDITTGDFAIDDNVKYSPSSPSISSSSPNSSDKHDDIPPIKQEHVEPSLATLPAFHTTAEPPNMASSPAPTPSKSTLSSSSSTSLSSSSSDAAKKPASSISKSAKPKQPKQDYDAPLYMQDFDPHDWADSSGLKYGIQISDSPIKSRVETQIKIALHFYPPPTESIVHLPADTISKPKLQLRDPFYPIPTALSLDTIVVCDSDRNRYVNMCSCCLNRERKRAFRKKVRLPVEEAHWSLDKEKRAIVFNCKEIVDFGPLVEVDVDGQTVTAKRLELPIRMACYCRHHNEKVGFRALFVLRDYTGKVVARGSTSSIMITDDHKASSSRAPNTAGTKRTNSEIESLDDMATPASAMPSTTTTTQNTPSPKSSDPALSDNLPRKKKMSMSGASTPLTALSTIPQSLVSSSSKRGGSSTQPKTKPRSARPSRSAIASPSSNFPSNASSPTYQFNMKSPVSPPNPSASPSATFDGISNAFYSTGYGFNGMSLNRPSSISSPVESPPHLSSLQQQPLSQLFSAVPSPQLENETLQNSNFNTFLENRGASNALPDIQKIIPQTGPVRGGIEVSLFGSNFIDGLVPKFGENKAISTICWSERSIVTQLPPSRYPGPVIVSFDGLATTPGLQIFSYYDDTDRQLIELALRVVGVKMNGKLEDARDIARRIVGTGTGLDSDIQSFRSGSRGSGNNDGMESHSLGMPLDKLESLLMKFVSLIDSVDNDRRTNWQLRNNEGQAILHLCSILGLEQFCGILLSRGAHVDIQDKNGYTPLHFAALHGHQSIISLLLRFHADSSLCTYFGQTYLSLLDDGSSRHASTLEFPDAQQMFAFNDVSDNEEEYEGDVEDDDDIDAGDDDLYSEYPLSQHQFAFVDDGNDDESSDYLSDESFSDNETLESDADNSNAAQQDGTTSPNTLANRIGSYFGMHRRPGPFNRRALQQEQPVEPLDSDSQHSSDSGRRPPNAMVYHYNNAITTGSAYLWGMFGRGAPVPGDGSPVGDDSMGSSPPNYYDIFPEGSGSNPDYSGAAIDEKTVESPVFEAADASASSSSAPQQEDTAESRQPTEDEVVEIWRNNRKKLQNDRMFLFFWLPVFIFTLVWLCYRMVVYMDHIDTSDATADGNVNSAATAAGAALNAGGVSRTALLRNRLHDSAATIAKKVLGFGKYQRRVVYDAVAASANAWNAQTRGGAAQTGAAAAGAEARIVPV